MTDGERNDRESIRVLMARYNIAGDQGRIEALADTFAEDGMLHFGGEASAGHTAIVARLGGGGGDRASARTVSRHHLATSSIEIDGDEATGRTYFSVLTNAGLDHHGVYIDRFRRVAGDWRIARREVRIDWQSPGSVVAPLWVRGMPPARIGA